MMRDDSLESFTLKPVDIKRGDGWLFSSFVEISRSFWRIRKFSSWWCLAKLSNGTLIFERKQTKYKQAI